jgi:hypothetical protein
LFLDAPKLPVKEEKMNAKPPSQQGSFESRCLKALRKLPSCQDLSIAEQALYERLAAVSDPLEWQTQADDTAVAETLWAKMAQNENQQIQIAAIRSALKGLRAVQAIPPGGFI